MSLPTPWTRHLNKASPDKKRDFETAVKNSTVIIDRMIAMLREELREVHEKEEELYENPATADTHSKHVYLVGRRKQIFKWLQNLEGIYHDR